jgi:hypothetical protein
MFPDIKMHIQIDHNLIDRRRYSSIFDVRSGGAKVRDRLSVSEQTTHRFHMETFSLKKLREVEGKEQFRVKI